MPNHRYDPALITSHIRSRERVVTHAELIVLGLSRSVICSRIGPNGPWQWALPGVVICHTGTPTARERILAALRYAGDDAVVTGGTALDRSGVRSPKDRRVHVLVPHCRQVTSHYFAVIERTRYLPRPIVRDGIPYAPIARAAIDAARRTRDPIEVVAMIADAVQRRLCTPEELHHAVAIAATQRSGLARRALREIDAGIRSAAETAARKALTRTDLPQPEWNVDLYTPAGEFIASPDAWWDAYGVALQIDSMQWHLSPELYKRTQALARAMGERGVAVLAWAPGDLIRDRVGFRRSVREFLAQSEGRPRPEVVVVRRSDPRARPG